MEESNQTLQATGLGMRKDKGQSWAWSQGRQRAADLGHLKGCNYLSHTGPQTKEPLQPKTVITRQKAEDSLGLTLRYRRKTARYGVRGPGSKSGSRLLAVRHRASHEVSGTLSYFTCKMGTFSHPPDLLQLGIQLKVFCEMPTDIIIPHDN